MTDVQAVCQRLGICRSAYYQRIRRGWHPEDARYSPRYLHRPRAGTGQDVNAVLRAWKRW